ncbi:hypothetical protein M918_21250 [Clostridium sp. BL8]|nr:hypothetical protein M918_21250 [Clostridium sp. BL8]
MVVGRKQHLYTPYHKVYKLQRGSSGGMLGKLREATREVLLIPVKKFLEQGSPYNRRWEVGRKMRGWRNGL